MFKLSITVARRACGRFAAAPHLALDLGIKLAGGVVGSAVLLNEAAGRRPAAKAFSPVFVVRFIPDIPWCLVY
jgi:hypothetical protein